MVETADIIIFDRARLRRNRLRHAPTAADFDFLPRWAQGRLNDCLDDVKREFEHALYIGPAATAPKHPKIRHLVCIDIGDRLTPAGNCVVADEEFLPFKDNAFDLILCNLTLHATNDLPGALLQMRRALKPDGLFVAALFGGETLHELRQSLMEAELSLRGGASPRVFPFADKPQMAGLLQRAGFALPVVDSEIVTVSYDNMFRLMHDLRGMAESNIIARRSRRYPGRDFFLKAAAHYTENFSEFDGKVNASFEVIFAIGWAPHESQQKPLRPGSAQLRLADALGASEHKTGEKAAP